MTQDLDTFMATMVGHPVPIGTALAERLVLEGFGVQATATPLTGERDENFRMTAAGEQYVFRVANPAEDRSITELPLAALLHVERADPDFPSPRVRRDLLGRTHIQFNDSTGLARTGSLVTYLPGRPLMSAARSPRQRVNCGRIAARLGRALRDFEHPASRRTLVWDLRNVPQLHRLLEELPSLPQAEFIADLITRFATDIAPRLATTRHQFIHNDLNSSNVLVDPADEAVVAGIIDFGDSVHTALIADVAIAAVAQVNDLATARESISDLVRGYEEIVPLLATELEILSWLMAARVVSAVLIRYWHRSKNPQENHFGPLDAELILSRVELARWLLAHPYQPA
jgi:Ser/Thr protein kinase RdoA (MazF antagonist)